ncbi:MAG TPA: Gfo/Idh/MocA family oxidoreductase [Bryobacteraceae bacterium]|jgi:predicted dehydrogenase|nr:Gfo/Idh/MocA family oxidoreductase [Bryobacteraceae bacterium]
MPVQTWTRRSVLLSLAAPLAAAPVRFSRRIRVAIAGLEGHTGEIVDPLPLLPDVEIVAVCDSDLPAVSRFLKNPRLAGARAYSGYRQMLDAETIDVVAVCNSNGERAEAVLACLERNLHVIAEKPLSITRPGIERIKAASARRPGKLGMLLPMRYDPQYRALRDIVRQGALGEVAQISAQKSYKAGAREPWYTQRATYGSTILWIGTHMIDLIRFTSGREITEASSFMGHVGFPALGAMETTTASAFRLDNGGAATLHMDYYRPVMAATHGDDRLRLAGTEGVAEYSDATGLTLVTNSAKMSVLEKLPPRGSVFVDFLEHVYNGKPASLPIEDIYRVCEVALAATEAASSGRVVRI